MNTMNFYSRPVLLSREQHRHKRIKAPRGYGFAARSNSLFLAGVEFAQASKEYPIVFTQMGQGKVVPVAILGLREGENLFVDVAPVEQLEPSKPSASSQPSEFAWQARYIPAFVRRYPFVLAELQGQQLGVCIDEGYAGFVDAPSDGEALFDSQGNNSAYLQGALDFLNRYQVEFLRTERFCQRLQELGLLAEMNAKIDMTDGRSFNVAGLRVIDERKLVQLPDAQALALVRSGELSWAYAHLLSLDNLNVLVDRLAQRKGGGLPSPAPKP
jgi:hypothetical protein